MEDRIGYFERMLAENPDNPTGLLALANEYGKAGRDEDEAAVLERYVATHEVVRRGRGSSVQRATPDRTAGHGRGRVRRTSLTPGGISDGLSSSPAGVSGDYGGSDYAQESCRGGIDSRSRYGVEVADLP